jgi:hypothetical protein
VQAVMGLPGRSLAVLRRGVYFLFHNARRALKALVVVVVVVVKLTHGDSDAGQAGDRLGDLVSVEEAATLQLLSQSECEPAILISWNDPAAALFHTAAAGIPVLLAIPPFAITPTAFTFKAALLRHLAAESAPGAAVIAGGTLGITCADGADRRLAAALSRLSDTPWAASVLAAAPGAARPLATVYVVRPGKDGIADRVFSLAYPPGQLFA